MHAGRDACRRSTPTSTRRCTSALLGTNGLTAYFGLLDVGRPQAGRDRGRVSAASGSVGHLVGQIARIQGCRVVGVAGSDEKCELLTGQLGFDAAVNHRDADVPRRLQGGDRPTASTSTSTTPAATSSAPRCAGCGRTAASCAAASCRQYDTADPAPGPRGIPGLLVNNRVRMEGFLVFDFADRYDEARAAAAGVDRRRRAGRRCTTRSTGLEQAPQAFVDLLAGGNVGTRIVRIA